MNYEFDVSISGSYVYYVKKMSLISDAGNQYLWFCIGDSKFGFIRMNVTAYDSGQRTASSFRYYMDILHSSSCLDIYAESKDLVYTLNQLNNAYIRTVLISEINLNKMTIYY